jgi:hypothetical protein
LQSFTVGGREKREKRMNIIEEIKDKTFVEGFL